MEREAVVSSKRKTENYSFTSDGMKRVRYWSSTFYEQRMEGQILVKLTELPFEKYFFLDVFA